MAEWMHIGKSPATRDGTTVSISPTAREGGKNTTNLSYAAVLDYQATLLYAPGARYALIRPEAPAHSELIMVIRLPVLNRLSILSGTNYRFRYRAHQRARIMLRKTLRRDTRIT